MRSGSAVSAGARSADGELGGQQRIVQEQVHAGLPGPAHGEELSAQGEEMVVLALVPHAVVAEALHQVGEDPGGPLHAPASASSSSSNQTAMAASAALCQVCRLENPSSKSPIRFAASSATAFDALVPTSSEQAPALAEQRGRREIVGEPDGLEIGGEEETARTEDVVAVGKIEVRDGVCRRGCRRRAPPRPSCPTSAPSAASVARALGEPEMLERGPTRGRAARR